MTEREWIERWNNEAACEAAFWDAYIEQLKQLGESMRHAIEERAKKEQ